MAAMPKIRAPHIEPALRAPLLSTLLGIAAATGLALVVPPAYAAAAAVAVMGLASLSALVALDARRRQEADALARNVGELNVRLGATRIKLEGLQSRVDSEPLREADIAPTRASLAELTAEVGLLGGVLRDVATAVSEHEARLAGQDAERAQPAHAPAATAPALVAQPAEAIDAGLRKREEAKLAAILDAFGAGGLEIHLQPVAALPQRRTVGYEALARLRLGDGSLLVPAEFIAALERAGQGASLDAQVLTQVLAIAGHMNSKGQDHFISLNLSSGTWAEARALGSIARVLETYRAQSARVVIEIPQRTWRQLDPTRLGIIGGMAANGLRFALDQVSDLRMDPAALSDRGVRFVKASAAVLSGPGERTAGLDIDAADLAQLLRRAGIELIGERAEHDRAVADLIDLDIRLAQGFAISQPRPVKPEAFQPAALPSGRSAAASSDALVDSVPLPQALAMRQGARGTASSQPASPQAAPAPRAAAEQLQQATKPERVPLRAVLRRA